MRWGPSWRPNKDGSRLQPVLCLRAPALALRESHRQRSRARAATRLPGAAPRRLHTPRPGRPHAHQVLGRAPRQKDGRRWSSVRRSSNFSCAADVAGLGRDLAVQPGTRLRPLAAHRDRRDPDHLRDLFQVRPPKNRSSTICAFRGSRSASSRRASSIATRSRERSARLLGFRDIHDADLATIAIFARRREMSTRMCRINRAAMATKWARFCQLTSCQFIKRMNASFTRAVV